MTEHPTLSVALCGAPDTDLMATLRHIAELPGCVRVAALPDCRAKPDSRVTPTSVVTVFRGIIVPQLLTRSINCGMALLRLDVPPDELIGRRDALAACFHSLLLERSQRLDPSRLLDIFEHGAPALFSQLNLTAETRAWYERHGTSELDDARSAPAPESLLPAGTCDDPIMMALPGNNFGGNHFVEWLAAGVGFENAGDVFPSDSTYGLFHFDAPITKVLSQNFRRRTPDEERTVLRLDSEEGRRFLEAVRLGMNAGYAWRLALMDLMVACVEAVIGRRVAYRLIWDGGHSTFRREAYRGEHLLVSRKGCVRADESRYGVIAGSYNVPSIVVERTDTTRLDGEWMNSYDHGIENLLVRESLGSGVQQTRLGSVTCYRAERRDSVWRDATVARHEVCRGPALEHVMAIYRDHPAAPVRPIGLLYPRVNYKLMRKTY